MNLRDLQYLIAVAKYKNFSKAAESCYVTQPTLSAQLKKLENELGITFFDRDKRNVRLTREGEEIVAHAKLICHEASQIKNIATQTKDSTAGELHIGVIPTSGPYLLTKLLALLKKNLPKMKIWWYEKQTQHLINDLYNGQCDAAILALPILDHNLESKPLFEESFLIAVSKKDSLAKKKNIKPQDLMDKTLLLLEEGHCLRDQALSICHQADLPIANQYRATSLETLRAMIASEAGVSFFPKLAATPHKDIVYLPLHPSFVAKRTMALVYKKQAVQRIRILKLYEAIKND